MKSQTQIRTKEITQEFIMVDNVNSNQATAQTEGAQNFNDKYGYDMITSV